MHVESSPTLNYRREAVNIGQGGLTRLRGGLCGEAQIIKAQACHPPPSTCTSKPSSSNMPTSPLPSPSTSPRQTPSLLPSPFPRTSTEAVRPVPSPVQATSASIYSLGRPDESHHEAEDDPIATDDDYPPLGSAEDGRVSLLPPPSFRPLFTLISDGQKNETYHPSVYYVFSDDAENDREGHDITTRAALRALEQNEASTTPQAGGTETEEDVEERFVFVDLAPGEDPEAGVVLKVNAASSLSPSWAVTAASLRTAPTFDDNTDDHAEAMMLVVEGLELGVSGQGQLAAKASSKSKKEEAERKAADRLGEARKKGGGVIEGMGELSKGFGEGLDMLERVLGESEDAKAG
jgi:hypothetical protein